MFLTQLAQHVEAWSKSLALSAEHEWTKAVESLKAFIEDEDAKVKAAVALLTAHGFTVTSPAPAPEAVAVAPATAPQSLGPVPTPVVPAGMSGIPGTVVSEGHAS